MLKSWHIVLGAIGILFPPLYIIIVVDMALTASVKAHEVMPRRAPNYGRGW